jgi:hypothetical protein
MRKILTVLLVVLGFGIPAGSAQAITPFSDGANFGINPDFSSGWASGSANGQNAIPTSLGSSISYYYDTYRNSTRVFTNFWVQGVWGDPLANNPYYNLLQNRGLNSSSSLSLTQITINGTTWEFDTPLLVSLNGFAGISRYTGSQPELYGYMNGSVNFQGLLPVNSWSSVQIYLPGHPTGMPDWYASMSSEAEVFGQIHPIPEPGTISLLGFGALALVRRRFSA